MPRQTFTREQLAALRTGADLTEVLTMPRAEAAPEATDPSGWARWVLFGEPRVRPIPPESREMAARIMRAVEMAVKAEREACAKVAEENFDAADWDGKTNAQNCARSIRERK